jgi:hypothetical protein
MSEQQLIRKVESVKLDILNYFKSENIHPEVGMSAMQILVAKQAQLGKINKYNYMAACKRAWKAALKMQEVESG